MANSIQRGLNILEYMAWKNKPSSLDEISEELNIPRTSCFRILKALQEERYIQLAMTKGREQKWELTYKLSMFADLVESRTSLRSLARPILENLADEVDLFVQLGILTNEKVMYIDDIKRSKVLRVYAAKWSLLDLHACAPGLVLLSFLSKKKKDEIINDIKLDKKTENTITDKEKLDKKLDEIKKNMYAIDDEYYARGIKCVASPIFNHRGDIIAAVGVTGHSEEFDEKRMPYIIDRVKKSAALISEKFEYKDYNLK